MDQFVTVAERELMPLLRWKRFRTLKKAATWTDDHLLPHHQVSQTGGWYRKDGGSTKPGSGGSVSSGPSGTPRRSVNFGSKTGFGKPLPPPRRTEQRRRLPPAHPNLITTQRASIAGLRDILNTTAPSQ